MPHLQKYTQPQVALILAHDLRAKDTSFKSADPELEKNNIYYLYNGERLEKVQATNKKLLQVAYKRQKYLFDNLPHTKRKDLVTLGEWVITCPRSIPKKDRIKFLQASVDFLCNRYGAENIACISLHLDEPNSMPHLHAAFVPVDSRGKICARNVLTRRELQHFHPDLERYTSQKLGYEVHILKDEDERTKESIPLSQYKVETKRKELEQKEKQVERQAQEAADKLETAENAISAAHFDAVEKAAAIMENYDKKGMFKRWLSDPRPFVRDMALELNKAAALEQAAADQRDKELDAREEAVQQKEQELQQKQKELARQEQELRQRLANVELVRKQAEERERAAEKREKIAAEQESAVAAKEKIVNEQESTLKARTDDYFKEQFMKLHTRERAADEILALHNDFKAQHDKWEKERAEWQSVERANKEAARYRKLYSDLNTRYMTICGENKGLTTANEQLKSLNGKLKNKVSKMSVIEKSVKELQASNAEYKPYVQKYRDLKALHSAVADYAEMMTFEYAFLSDIVSDFNERGMLSTEQKMILQTCDQRTESFAAQVSSNEQHVERIGELVDAAEKKKDVEKSRINAIASAAARENRQQRQQSRGIHRQSSSRGRSR